MVWEVRGAGSDTNGGGYKPGASGTDWSQQNAAQYALTNGTSNGTTTILTVSAVADMVGNTVYVAGGTGTITGTWLEITGQSTGTSISVDAPVSASVGLTLNIGGALKSPGVAAGAGVTSNKFYVKSNGVYSCSSSNNVADGRVTTGSTQYWEGYLSSRGDLASPPELKATSDTIVVFKAGDGTRVVNIKANGDSPTRSAVVGFGDTNGVFVTWQQCVATGCGDQGFKNSADAVIYEQCEAVGCVVGYGGLGNGNRMNSVNFCSAITCTTGFSGGPASLNRCIASGCTTGFAQNNDSVLHNCDAYATSTSGTKGFSLTTRSFLYGCYAEGAGTGFDVQPSTYLNKCAGFGNSTDVSGSPVRNFNFQTLSASGVTNAGGGDFSPNNTAGAGALLRGTSQPATWTGLSTTSYPDIGAAQHADAAAGGMIVNPKKTGGKQ